MKNFYDILNVSINSSQEDIKCSYRKLAQIHHPDKKSGNKEKFQEINEAYMVLSNDKTRSEYNLLLSKNINKPIISNTNIHMTMNISMYESITGFDKIFYYKKNGEELIGISVKHGPNVPNGKKIKYVGYGNDTNKFTKSGDLIITFKIVEQENIKIKNNIDLITILKVDYITASIGGEKYIDGIEPSKILKFLIPESVRDGDILISEDLGGLSDIYGNRGKFYGIVKLIPPKLSKKKKEALTYINSYIEPEEMIYRICSTNKLKQTHNGN